MSWFRRNYYALVKLHSLSGVVPIGLFVIYHFYTHNYSWHGPEVWDARVQALYSRPFWPWFEVLAIYLPIAFHAGLGVLISLKSRPNAAQYPYFSNLKYTLQRLSGLGLVAFIIAHVYKTRFSQVFLDVPISWAHEAAGLASPLTFGTYIIGILGAAFHLANGLWTFLISWGIARGPRAYARTERASILLFLILAFVGFRALLGFIGEPQAGLPAADVARSATVH
jgi:succinate dehydrogenase / fumarate reductase cytochrome b subunit